MYPQSQALKDRLLIHLSKIIGFPSQCLRLWNLSPRPPQATPESWAEMAMLNRGLSKTLFSIVTDRRYAHYVSLGMSIQSMPLLGKLFSTGSLGIFAWRLE